MECIGRDVSSALESIMYSLKSGPDSSTLRSLKSTLNKFFKDSECREVIYTDNTDKLFFGMCVMPFVNGDDAMGIVASNAKIRIKSYYLELDSKLFQIGLSARELVAILLHEIGHIVNNCEPVEDVRKAVDTYLDKNDTTIKLSDAAQYKDILAFAVKDSIRKFTSLFLMPDNEILADEFVVSCGYGKDIESAYSRILRSAGRVNRDVDEKLIVLQWTLRLYTDVKFKRIGSIHVLQRAKKITASELANREMNIVIAALNQIDDDTVIKESLDIFKNTDKIYKNFKYSGMRELENSVYELQMRVKNVEVEDEALSVLREINGKLAIIDDYTMSEKLSESELKRWWDLRDKYLMLRDDLSKKQLYSGRYYGLFVNSPTVKSRSSLNI